MNLLIIGPPGAGKGTQSEMICKKYNIQQLSTGDILRANVKSQSQLGKIAEEYMSSGKLVPDDLIIMMMKDEILKPKYEGGFILDGFPRTITQAEALNSLLEDLNLTLDKVIVLQVPNEIIVERISGRRSCRNCNRTYHIKYNPPPLDGECDCGNSDIYQRDDDKEDTVRNRLDVYQKQTEPIVDFYRKISKVAELDGTLDLNVVFEEIIKILE